DRPPRGARRRHPRDGAGAETRWAAGDRGGQLRQPDRATGTTDLPGRPGHRNVVARAAALLGLPGADRTPLRFLLPVAAAPLWPPFRSRPGVRRVPRLGVPRMGALAHVGVLGASDLDPRTSRPPCLSHAARRRLRPLGLASPAAWLTDG